MASEVEYAGRIAAAPACEFERIMDEYAPIALPLRRCSSFCNAGSIVPSIRPASQSRSANSDNSRPVCRSSARFNHHAACDCRRAMCSNLLMALL